MRINGFEQMKAFYSWVFDNQQNNIRTTHIALYMFLLNQNNRNNWVEWFKCPFDLAMSGSGITNKKTYYNTLLELQDFSLIKYKKGINNYKAPLIKIEVLFDTSTVPQSEPQMLPQVIPLPAPLLLPQLLPNIKLLTSNIQPITINIKKVLEFLSIELKGPFTEHNNNAPEIYTDKQFLEDWNKLRTENLKKPSHMNRMGRDDIENFNDIKKYQSREDFKKAMVGLFKQKVLPNGNTTMQTSPSHFLKYFNGYLQAYYDQNDSMYGKKQVEI